MTFPAWVLLPGPPGLVCTQASLLMQAHYKCLHPLQAASAIKINFVLCLRFCWMFLFCLVSNDKALVVFAHFALPPDRERWRLVGYNVVEIRPNSVRISAVVVYSASSQVTCCILLGAAAIYRCWLLSKPVGYLENLVQANIWMAAAAILTSTWEC